jgi:hypothetical protein
VIAGVHSLKFEPNHVLEHYFERLVVNFGNRGYHVLTPNSMKAKAHDAVQAKAHDAVQAKAHGSVKVRVHNSVKAKAHYLNSKAHGFNTHTLSSLPLL